MNQDLSTRVVDSLLGMAVVISAVLGWEWGFRSAVNLAGSSGAPHVAHRLVLMNGGNARPGWRSRFLSLGTAAVAGSLVLAPGPAQADDTEFSIQVFCNDVSGAFPLAGVRVELWRRGLDELPKVITDTLVGVSHAAADGRVGVRVSGDEDDFYFRIVLADNDGVRAERHAYPWAWFADTDTNQNDVPVQDYGTIGLGDGSDHPPCTAFEGVRRAYQDFIATTGSRPPYDVTVQLNAPGRSVPGAVMDEINWPAGWPSSAAPVEYAFLAATHEFAHTFRDGLDGDEDHRADDAKRFGYAREHSACDRFNEGFAFQEGWAEFWARQQASQCPRASLSDFAYEGHVNLGLASIERWCMSRAEMVEVLRRNPGRIHSFAEYAKAADCEGRIVSPFAPGAGEIEALPSVVVLNSLAKQRHIGLTRERRTYTTQWKKAVKAADRLGACKSSCARQLAASLEPAWLRLQRRQVDLLIDSYTFERTSKGRKALGPPGSLEFERALRQVERKYRKRAIAIGKAAVQELSVAARPYLRRAGANGEFVGKRLWQLRHELRQGRIPVGLLPSAPGTQQTVELQGPPADGGTCVIERGGERTCA